MKTKGIRVTRIWKTKGMVNFELTLEPGGEMLQFMVEEAKYPHTFNRLERHLRQLRHEAYISDLKGSTK